MLDYTITDLFGFTSSGDKVIDFHKGYLKYWISGTTNRSYENYIRDIRTALGRDTFSRTVTFTSVDSDATVNELREYCGNLDIQICFTNQTLLWGFKLDDGFPVFCIEATIEENRVSITIEGDMAYVDAHHLMLAKVFSNDSLIHLEKLTMGPDGTLDTSGKFVERTNSIVAKNVYYPWLSSSVENFSLESFAEAFMASSSNALLLYGERGTGKSTFIRTLLFLIQAKRNIMITDEPTMRSQSFRKWLEHVDEGSVIVIDDADNIIGKREDGNEAMVSLLNITSGVIPKNVKIIISTNLGHLNHIDTALLRAGRMFAALEFKRLYGDDITAVRSTEGLPAIPRPAGGLTLAEVLNYEHLHREFKTTKVGFHS